MPNANSIATASITVTLVNFFISPPTGKGDFISMYWIIRVLRILSFNKCGQKLGRADSRLSWQRINGNADADLKGIAAQ
jgi:hypothetical protein